MAYLGNTPGQATILQVEARKSFALGLRLMDPKGKPVDLTDCTVTIVAKAEPVTETGDNLLAADATAELVDPAQGFARFNIQAATLDHKPGEYPYAIVLRTAEGFSSVIVKGVLDIQQNTEFESVLSSYSGVNAPQSLSVRLRGANAINVFVGGQLPPGMNYVRDDVVETIESFDPDSVAMVPTGGTPGYALVKTGAGDYAMAWRPQAQGTLDAAGQPSGVVPVAVGDDTWTWGAVGIDATDVPAGHSPVSDGANGWTWAEAQTTVDWSAPDGEPGSILNKPELGSAAAKDESDFLSALTLLSQLPGVHFQSTVPTTGIDGHVYFVYEA